MLRLYIKDQYTERDYSRYVDWSSVQIQAQLSVPSQLTATLYQFDQEFVPPASRFAVRLWSDQKNRNVWTGFIAVTPDQALVAVSAGQTLAQQQFFQYKVTCTSDEYLLNFKATPYIPAFICQTQGQILARLANILMPGFYDTSLIQPGQLVPYFVYDPTKTWSAYAKEFCDAAHYYYFVRDRKIVFAPYGDQPLGIDYDEDKPKSQWNSSKLSTTVFQSPTVNDVTVIGDTEAGASHDDYMIGDGFTGEYPLKYATFQSKNDLLLQDDLTAEAVNTQNWTLNDPQNQFDFTAGALNVVSPLSGPTTTGQLIANNGVELAGGIELQHGEFQWNDESFGEVGGLYFDGTITQSIAAFNISTPGTVTLSASGAAGILMTPTISGVGVADGILSQVNHHYVLRTRISAPAETRFQQAYSTKDGTVYGGQQVVVLGTITWEIEDVDIGATYNQSLTGIYNDPVSHTFAWTVTGALLPAYAAYALIRNDNILPTSALSYTDYLAEIALLENIYGDDEFIDILAALDVLVNTDFKAAGF